MLVEAEGNQFEARKKKKRNLQKGSVARTLGRRREKKRLLSWVPKKKSVRKGKKGGNRDQRGGRGGKGRKVS